MWNTAGTLYNFQEGYRATTRKWLGHESGAKRLLSVDSSLPDLYTTLTPQPPGNRQLAFKESASTQEEREAADVTDQKHRGPLLAARGVRREENFPQEALQPSDPDHILIYVAGQKTPPRFSILKPPRGKSVPVGFSRENRRSMILGRSTR